jgi:hypothetical protein
MPSWLNEILKALGFSTPLLYAAATFGVFRWLDKSSSAAAKIAITNWLQPKRYDKEVVAAAVIEIFNRLYTPQLLSMRAFTRSALFTICMTGVFWYEFYSNTEQPNVLKMAFNRDSTIVKLLAGAVFINIFSDYMSLFVVKRLLIFGKQRPLVALWIGPIVGMGVVMFFALLRDVGITLYLDMDYETFSSALFDNIMINFDSRAWTALLISALIVHLWLPLFFICVIILRGTNYLRIVVGWTQWFLKKGGQHPFEAIGYAAAAIVFASAVIFQWA